MRWFVDKPFIGRKLYIYRNEFIRGFIERMRILDLLLVGLSNLIIRGFEKLLVT